MISIIGLGINLIPNVGDLGPCVGPTSQLAIGERISEKAEANLDGFLGIQGCPTILEIEEEREMARFRRKGIPSFRSYEILYNIMYI